MSKAISRTIDQRTTAAAEATTITILETPKCVTKYTISYSLIICQKLSQFMSCSCFISIINNQFSPKRFTNDD